MKATIRNWYTGQELFSLTTPHNSLAKTLQAAILDNVNLQFANLSYCDFSGMNFDDRDFSHCNFIGSRFNNALMRHGQFNGCQMEGCNFTKADLTDSEFIGTDMSMANFTDAIVEWTDFHLSMMRKANLTNLNLLNTIFGDTTFSDNVFSNTKVGEYLLIGNTPIFQTDPIDSSDGDWVAFMTDKGIIVKTPMYTAGIKALHKYLDTATNDPLAYRNLTDIRNHFQQ